MKRYTLKDLAEKASVPQRQLLDKYITILVFEFVLAGYLISVACSSLIQDFMGKEKWIAIISEHWINPLYTVPLALLMLFWTAGIITNARKNLDNVIKKVKLDDED